MRRNLIVYFLIISFAMAYAQEHEYTLGKAINRAMHTNRDLKIASLEKKRADEKYWEALSTALPQINGQMNVTQNFKLPFFYLSFPDSTGKLVSQKINVGYKWQYSALVNLQQPIYTFGRVGSALNIADYYEEATDNDYITARDGVIEATYLAYTTVHLAAIKIRVSKFNYDIAQSNYELVKHRYEAGLSSEFELLQAKVNMDNILPDVIQSKGEYERSINSLKVVLNIPMDFDIKISDSLTLLVEDIPYDKSDMWERSDFKAEEWRLKMYSKNRQIMFSYHLPEIDANMQYQFTGANDNFARNEKIEGETLNLSVGMQIPLFSGFRTDAQYQQSVIDFNQAQYRLAKKKDDMESIYENAKIKMDESQKRLIATRGSRESARRALEIARVQKAAGGITELDLQASQLAYQTSERNYYLSVFDYNVAYIALLKSVGKLGQLFELQTSNGE